MNANATITYRDVAKTEALETEIRERIAWLEEHCPKLVGCHVMVERPHRHRNRHQIAHVRIDLTVPGAEIVVARDPDQPEHEDLSTAVRDAFHTARRRLDDHLRRQRDRRRSA